MPNYRYLIVGGGMAADAAVQGIRELDPHGTIGLITDEAHPPYNRPPLSKGLWNGQSASEIWRGTEERVINLHLERSATRIDPLGKTVRDNAGDVYGYEKLLLATGGTPRRLGGRDDGVIYFRTLADYYQLQEITGKPRRIAVIGGGFIGAEISAALCMNGHEVHLIYPERTPLARTLPHDLAGQVTRHYESKGVKLYPGHSVRSVIEQGHGYLVAANDKGSVEADVVVAGIGLVPNTEIAEAAGLIVSDGICVNHFLQTSNTDIFAAGDVANIYDSVFERPIRVEHEDNSNTMGMHAGKAMTGFLEAYTHLPFFYSDLFELGFEAVGRVDARLETVSDWVEPFQEGVVYFLENGHVQGVLLWNTWGKVDAARALIRSKRPVASDEVPSLLLAV
jgi:3-phenylpropionate/trans-cinnamate dioxygenase ferredoxin reductase subunit